MLFRSWEEVHPTVHEVLSIFKNIFEALINWVPAEQQINAATLLSFF